MAMDSPRTLTDEQIEQAARSNFAGDIKIDWSDDANLFASAVQRAYFRSGAKWAFTQSCTTPKE